MRRLTWASTWAASRGTRNLNVSRTPAIVWVSTATRLSEYCAVSVSQSLTGCSMSIGSMPSTMPVSGITNRLPGTMPLAASMASKWATSSVRWAGGTRDRMTPRAAPRSLACCRISHTGASAYRLALVMNSHRSDASRNW